MKLTSDLKSKRDVEDIISSSAEPATQAPAPEIVAVVQWEGKRVNCCQQLIVAEPVDEDIPQLKELFLAWMRKAEESLRSLKNVIIGLLDRGISRQTMVDWAIEAGFAEATARSVVSRVSCGAGRRCNAGGQGRPLPAEADELLHLAVERYGEEKAVRLLGAAHRLGERRLKSRTISVH